MSLFALLQSVQYCFNFQVCRTWTDAAAAAVAAAAAAATAAVRKVETDVRSFVVGVHYKLPVPHHFANY